jgi:hypothetical protein
MEDWRSNENKAKSTTDGRELKREENTPRRKSSTNCTQKPGTRILQDTNMGK